MVTTDGRRIEVLDPGLLNRDAGPDFFNAKILIDGQQWAGNIEIHARASDWLRHGHDSDSAYDTVVLHVVEHNDADIYRRDGQKIPQMIMKCAADFSRKYQQMVNNPTRDLPCGAEVGSLPSLYITDWLSALAFERLYAKSERIDALLKDNNQDWAETIYVTLARALGFSTNSQPFELLAKSTPLKVLLHHADDVRVLEAILFGQAGLLDPCYNGPDEYIMRLVQDYNFYSRKYSLRPSANIVWKMARMRPHNFPHRRIAALAAMIASNVLFSNRALEVEDERTARGFFDVTLSPYWGAHFTFGQRQSVASQKAFSFSSVTVLLINVVAPLICAYASYLRSDSRMQYAVDLLHALRPESNRIIDIFAAAGIGAPDAFATQALIQLRREYCEPRKCLFCRIGHKLLSQKVKRASGA